MTFYFLNITCWVLHLYKVNYILILIYHVLGVTFGLNNIYSINKISVGMVDILNIAFFISQCIFSPFCMITLFKTFIQNIFIFDT